VFIYLLIYFILTRAETLIFAVCFLSPAESFVCISLTECLKAPLSSREFTAKLMQTLSSQVPHDHLSSNASQEATAPADTEA